MSEREHREMSPEEKKQALKKELNDLFYEVASPKIQEKFPSFDKDFSEEEAMIFFANVGFTEDEKASFLALDQAKTSMRNSPVGIFVAAKEYLSGHEGDPNMSEPMQKLLEILNDPDLSRLDSLALEVRELDS
jgi:hypothetical protein